MIQRHHDKNGAERMHKIDQGSVNPRLLDLINKHHVSTIHPAHAAGLRIDTVRAMALQGKPVQPVVAMQVLYGLWELTGKRYLITQVDMPLLSYNGMTPLAM